MIRRGIRSPKGMALFMLLASGILPAACATGIDARPDLHAALARYRYEFVKVHPGEVLPDSDPDYILFAGAMRLVLGAYVIPTAPHLLVDRALEGMWARKESEPDASRRVLTESAIDGMLSGLDPYSGFLDAEHVNDLREQIHGQYAGSVRLPAQVGMTRPVLRVRPLMHRLEGTVAYVSIASFNEQTAQGLTEAIERMRLQTGGRLAGAVLDLRNNPGGLLEQGIKVAGRFLGAAEIVSTRGRAAATQHYRSNDSVDLLRGAPLMVLINGFSSSASEIVAGALQDHGRAVLLGTRSYGKGSVQTVFWLPAGEGIRLTTAHYFRPSGASVDCFGIFPNVEIMPTPYMKEPLNPTPAVTALPDHAACDQTAAPPPPPRWSMDELCPDIARAASGAPPERAPERAMDVPLECAIAAIRTGRMRTPARP